MASGETSTDVCTVCGREIPRGEGRYHLPSGVVCLHCYGADPQPEPRS